MKNNPHLRKSALVLALLCVAGGAWADDPMLAEVRLFAFNWCPQGWLMAGGQVLSLQQNTALFSLLGTSYGGNGSSNFVLPDLRGRTPVGQGQAAGLPLYSMGEVGGQESVTITAALLPPHLHSVAASAVPAAHATPAVGDRLAQMQNGGLYVDGSVANTAYPSGLAGQNQPFAVRQPYVVMNWCVALNGLYPARP